MITEKQLKISSSVEKITSTWQMPLVQAITDPQELMELLVLDDKFIEPAILAAR